MKAFNKFPLLALAITFSLGILISAYLPFVSFWGFALLLLAAVLCYQVGKKRLSKLPELGFQASFLAAMLICGQSLGSLAFQVSPNDISFFQGQNVQLELELLDAPRQSGKGYSAFAKVLPPMEGKILLHLSEDSKDFQQSDILVAELQVDTLFSNSTGYQSYLSQMNVRTQGNEVKVLARKDKGWLAQNIMSIRSGMAAKIEELLPAASTIGFAKALLLGDKSDLDREMRQDFANAGLSHVLAISGMHLGILYLALQSILSFLLRFSSGRKIRAFVIVILLFGFAFMVGGSPSAYRAAIMLGLLELANGFNRKHHALNALAVSGLISLVLDPSALFNIGFQLSYAAVLGILILQSPVRKYLKQKLPFLGFKTASAIAVTLAAQFATAPLVAFHFHSFPTYFLFSNLLLLPLVSVVTNLGFAGFVLAWLPGIAKIWAGAMDFGLYLLGVGAQCFSNLPGANIKSLDFAETGLWMLLAQILLAFICLERKILKELLLGKASELHLRRWQIRQTAFTRRAAWTGIATAWLLLGFLA